MIGKLAASCGVQLQVGVMRSAAGFYLGTSEQGIPFTRESNEYWPSQKASSDSLIDVTWTQKHDL